MQGFTVVDLVILVIYLAAVLFAGLHFAKKDKDILSKKRVESNIKVNLAGIPRYREHV